MCLKNFSEKRGHPWLPSDSGVSRLVARVAHEKYKGKEVFEDGSGIVFQVLAAVEGAGNTARPIEVTPWKCQALRVIPASFGACAYIKNYCYVPLDLVVSYFGKTACRALDSRV